MPLVGSGSSVTVTERTSGCAEIASGSRDTEIRNFFRAIRSSVNTNSKQPVVFTFFHEPLGDAKDNPSAATDWLNSMNKILDIVESDTQLGANAAARRAGVLFAPVFEEFTFRSGTPTKYNHSIFHNTALMNRFDFYGFDMYQFDNTAANNEPGARIDVVRNYVHGIRPGMMFGIGEHAGRNEYKLNQIAKLEDPNDGTGVPSSRQSAAQWYRLMSDYIFSHANYFWIASYYNSIGESDERLIQPMITSYAPIDTESLISIFREKLLSTNIGKIP